MNKLGRVVAVVVSLFPLAPLVAEEAPRQNRVNLSASATGQVENDTMVVVMFAQEQGKEAAPLALEVNRAVSWGIDQAKMNPDFKVQTQAYSTQPVYHKNVITGWRVRQSFKVESTNTAALSDALGVWQQQLALQSVSFKVSPASRADAENALITDALKAFEQRAKIIAEAFGMSSYQRISTFVVTPDDNPNYYPQISRMEVSKSYASSASPAMEAGDAQITVSVNGEIELKH